MKRIGLIQIHYETCSFNPFLTEIADFHLFDPLAPGIIDQARFHGQEVRGFLQGLEQAPEPTEPIVLLMAQGFSGGPLTPATRTALLDALQSRLSACGRFDGLLVALHGAMSAQDEDDFDGQVLERIREQVGPQMPVVVTLDLHAQLTARMLRNASVIVAYHTNPHLDRVRTGLRASRVLQHLFAGARPATAAVRLPMIVPGEHTLTTSSLLAPVFNRVKDLELQAGMLSVAVLMAQPYMDVPDLGWSTLVTSDGDPAAAQAAAEELADACWQQRAKLGDTSEFLSAADSVEQALQIPGKPVVIADGADATNSGAPGDSTHLLRELLGRAIPGGALTVMVDPQAVAAARAEGPGSPFAFAVGGKRDHVFSQPLPITGQVEFLKPLHYMLSGHIGDNLPIDMGLAAAVRCRDVTVLLVEKSGPGSTPLMYRCVGLEPKDFKIVIVKSPAGFRADYGPFAAGIIQSVCPGCALPILNQLPYSRVSRPLYPLDDLSDRRIDWCLRSWSGPGEPHST